MLWARTRPWLVRADSEKGLAFLHHLKSRPEIFSCCVLLPIPQLSQRLVELLWRSLNLRKAALHLRHPETFIWDFAPHHWTCLQSGYWLLLFLSKLRKLRKLTGSFFYIFYDLWASNYRSMMFHLFPVISSHSPKLLWLEPLTVWVNYSTIPSFLWFPFNHLTVSIICFM